MSRFFGRISMFTSYRRFFGFLWRYRARSIFSVLLITLYASIQAIQPYFYKLFIDTLPSRSYSLLLNIFLLYGGIRFLHIGIDIATSYVSDGPLIHGARDARIAVFRKVQDLDFAFHLSRSTGSLISIFKRGDAAFFSLFQNMSNLYTIFVQLIIMLLVFGHINLLIMTLMLATFLFSLVATYIAIKYNIGTRRIFNEWEDKISAVVVDNLINYETVKYFGKEKREDARLSVVFRDWTKSLWKYGNSFRVIDVIVGISSNIGFFVILLVALKTYLAGTMSLSDVVMIIGFITAFYPRLFEMVYKFREIAKSHADMEGYFSVLDLQEEVMDPVEPKVLPHVRGEIVFADVCFSYKEGQKNALDRFNLTIKPGESVAFVGKSGVGKTTIVKLLLRFFDVDAGAITIDGINIKNFTKSQLRSYMGVVPQEPVLFNNSIAFNIAYGSDTATPADIARVAKMANLDEFIGTLPEKYETQVGERGVKLSGGQKQRLAIARMLLANPDIIIFDEATSQLDSESEKYIQDAFWKVVKNRTTLIIAHRLSTIAHADKIVVMHKGRVAEMGKHEELLKIPEGLYKRYWDLQVKSV